MRSIGSHRHRDGRLTVGAVVVLHPFSKHTRDRRWIRQTWQVYPSKVHPGSYRGLGRDTVSCCLRYTRTHSQKMPKESNIRPGSRDMQSTRAFRVNLQGSPKKPKNHSTAYSSSKPLTTKNLRSIRAT